MTHPECAIFNSLNTFRYNNRRDVIITQEGVFTNGRNTIRQNNCFGISVICCESIKVVNFTVVLWHLGSSCFLSSSRRRCATWLRCWLGWSGLRSCRLRCSSCRGSLLGGYFAFKGLFQILKQNNLYILAPLELFHNSNDFRLATISRIDNQIICQSRHLWPVLTAFFYHLLNGGMILFSPMSSKTRKYEDWTIEVNYRIILKIFSILAHPFFGGLFCTFGFFRLPTSPLSSFINWLVKEARHRSVFRKERFLCRKCKSTPCIDNICFISKQSLIIVAFFFKAVPKCFNSRIYVSKIFSQCIKRMHFAENFSVWRKLLLHLLYSILVLFRRK